MRICWKISGASPAKSWICLDKYMITVDRISNVRYTYYRRNTSPSFKGEWGKTLEHEEEKGLSLLDKLRLVKTLLVTQPETVVEMAKNALTGTEEKATASEPAKTCEPEPTSHAVKEEKAEGHEHKTYAYSGYTYSESYSRERTSHSSKEATSKHKSKNTSKTKNKTKTKAETQTKIQEYIKTFNKELWEQIQIQSQKIMELSDELAAARIIYKGLLKRYRELCDKECNQKFFYNWHSWDLELLKTRTAELKEELSYQEMVQNAAKVLRKGGDEYVPPEDKSVFDLSNLSEITPNKNRDYVKELYRMCEIFLKNSAACDNALVAFNNLHKLYAQEAAKGIKEIFALQNDKTNKILERIPKLGLIPKALRVNDQLKLTKCIMSDYEELTNKYVIGGLTPFMKKYNLQYNQILDFINSDQIQYDKNKVVVGYLLNIIEGTRQKRVNADYKILNSYSSNGMNISNICNQVKRRGLFDLARKTVLTLAPFF